MHMIERFLSREHWVPLTFLLVLSYATIVHGFSQPQALFWDENYHIASAQKYQHGVFFMEPHPPLGKLLIAAGEALLDRNKVDDQFVGTDYATNPPDGFDFTGYRLFPVLLAWLTAPVLYAIFFLVTRKPTWTLLFSLLYVFDNALIVHARSAMLDSTLLFFSALTLLGFFLLVRPSSDRSLPWHGLLFGVAFGCALATKAFALIFALLVPIVWWHMRRDTQRIATVTAVAGMAFLVTFLGTWYVHFALFGTVDHRLPDNGYYQSSDASINIIDDGKTASIFAFPVLLRDAFAFVSHYQANVPELDLAKADENGSPWFLWPIGARTINYRWETPDGYSYRYLYLVPNPAVWFFSLLGVVVAAILFCAPYIAPDAKKSPVHREIGSMLLLYACYLIAVSRIDRVMYLYHYFLPLAFSFVLLALVFASLRNIGRLHLDDDRRTWGLLTLAILTFIGFQFYRPFTYYEPMTDDAVETRAIVKLWDLHCVECEAPHVLAKPTRN